MEMSMTLPVIFVFFKDSDAVPPAADEMQVCNERPSIANPKLVLINI